MKKYSFHLYLILCIALLVGPTAGTSYAQSLPISDDFSLCATVDSRSREVQIGWNWTGTAGEASGYSIYPEDGEIISINNPSQTEATFQLEKNRIRNFYVLRQAMDGEVYRSNDVRVRLKKTSLFDLLIPGLHQAKKPDVIASNCPGYRSNKRFNISRPLMGAFGASVVAWGAVFVAKHNNRNARNKFLFEEATRYTPEAFADWEKAYDTQRTFRDIAVITTAVTYAVHLVSLFRTRSKGLQPEIFNASGLLSSENVETKIQLGLLENDPSMSLTLKF